MTALAAALDIGGTKVSAGIVDLTTGTVLDRHGAPTPGPEGGDGSVIAGLVDELRGSELWSHVTAFGIASAGPLDLARGTIAPFNIAHWHGLGVHGIVRAQVGALPVRLVGDGTAMAYAEQVYGAGQGADNVLGIVVSTGVGGGLVVDGRCVEGARGNAGLIGHVVVEPGGTLCPCGRRGCVETIASGPSIVRRAQLRGWRRPDGGEGVDGDARAVVAAADAGDPVATAVVEEAVSALARGIASAMALLDLEVVVLGGGVGLGLASMVERVSAAVAAEPGAAVEVRRAALGHDAGLVGAARLAAAS